MPTHTGKDRKGCFAQWGSRTKYYYTCGNEAARKRAVAKAEKQGAAIRASGWHEHMEITAMNAEKHFAFVRSTVNPAMVRNDTMEGREYLVVPAVMMVEGVHAGDAGPILYPAEELAQLPITANHKPVVVYHPERNGQGISACDPIEVTARKIGVIMRASSADDGKKQKAEAWLDAERIQAVDSRVQNSLDEQKMMEVSLGLYMDLERTEGEWNGEQYIGIAHNLRTDHLAVLPDRTGACSIADGAGLLRTNEDPTADAVEVTENSIRVRQKPIGSFQKNSMGTVWINRNKGVKAVVGRLATPPEGQEAATFVQSYLFDKENWTTAKAKTWVAKHKELETSAEVVMNEIGHEQLRRQLSEMLQAKYEDAWIEEVYNAFVIYEQAGNMFRQEYEVGEDEALQLTGLPTPVVKVVEYRKTDGSLVATLNQDQDSTEGEDNMNKEEIVQALIENKDTPWTEADKDTLMGFSDEVLMHLQAKAPPPPADPPQEDEPAGEPPVDNAQKPTKVLQPEPKPLTEEEYINNAPPRVREILRQATEFQRNQQTKLVKQILANQRNRFTEAYLNERSLSELEGLVALMGIEQQPSGNPLYQGQAPIVDSQQEDSGEPLHRPQMSDLIPTA